MFHYLNITDNTKLLNLLFILYKLSVNGISLRMLSVILFQVEDYERISVWRFNFILGLGTDSALQ